MVVVGFVYARKRPTRKLLCFHNEVVWEVGSCIVPSIMYGSDLQHKRKVLVYDNMGFHI